MEAFLFEVHAAHTHLEETPALIKCAHLRLHHGFDGIQLRLEAHV